MKSNARELAQKMRRRGQAVRVRLEQNAKAEAVILNREAENIMRTEIYGVPVPQSSTGRPKWVRTGELQRGERVRVIGADILLFNTAGHSGPRSRLGTSRGRPIRSPGIRSVQWQEKAVQRRRAQLLKMKRQAVLAALQSA